MLIYSILFFPAFFFLVGVLMRWFVVYLCVQSYASILYLRLPSNFRMILRGKDIKHHNISDDMMLKEEITYRPQHSEARKAFKDKDVLH